MGIPHSKLTATLMGNGPKFQEETDEDQEAAARLNKSQLAAVVDMASSTGWALFQQHLQIEEARILTEMSKAMDPTSISKLAGALLQVRTSMTWARDTAEALKD